MTRIAVVLITVVAALAAAPAAGAQSHGGSPEKPFVDRAQRFVPKTPGTKETKTWWFGPYAVAPGHDGNRADIELPVHKGMMVSAEPSMRRVADLSEPSHQEAHIHHAHWFAADPGNEEDNYTGGNTEWIFGNGDEETRADFQPRSAADPNGIVYGQYIDTPQLMIYMLHNKTNQPLNVYIALDVTFIHGTMDQLNALGDGSKYHDTTGILFGRTYDVPRGRDGDGDGNFEYAEDAGRVIEWTSTVDGTMIGMGGHLHPGGLQVVVENFGSAAKPCASDGRGYGGTDLLYSDALFHDGVLFSEDFQMEVSHEGWRAPIRKGDRIRISGTYESAEHAWYAVMTHLGIYVDEQQPPQDVAPGGGRDCGPKLVGGPNADTWEPTAGIPNREWGHHADEVCGEEYGAGPCEPGDWSPARGQQTGTVVIGGFVYAPGDQGFRGGSLDAIPWIRQGERLRFVNADQPAGIRHTVTTCPWPCDGRYVANYPLADGVWDSDTLGYDPVDGGNPNPVAETPPDLEPGKYAYFCRIHPWMRGGFEVVAGSALAGDSPLRR